MAEDIKEELKEAPEGFLSWSDRLTTTRRGMVKLMGISCAALALANTGFKPSAWAADTSIEFPKPSGALYDTVNGIKVLTCYSTSTTANFSEMLGLNCPSFYPVEYDEYAATSLSQSPTLGLWGSSWNSQPNAFLSNLVYRDEMGGEVDDDYVAVIGSALQGFSQNSGGVSDEMGGIPVFMYHRPEILAISSTDTWSSDIPLTGPEFVKIINDFDPAGPYYKEGDESYDPAFVDMRGYYGEKLGYMYSMWEVAAEANRRIGSSNNTRVGRYGSVLDIAALFEEYMLASQCAVLRAIGFGSTHRKTVAVMGGISDQTQGIENGVNLATGRARLDKFDPLTTDFASSTNWGSVTNYNVRYYHASAALENCCDNIIDVLGVSDPSDTDAPIIEDEDGICWARPEALMQTECIVVRTQTTVSDIPGMDELYQILREYGYTDQNAWPDIYTANPTIPGYGASNTGQLFWWGAYLGFVYPEVINPVYMGAFCCEEFYHVASTYLEEAIQLLYGEMSLPKGYELSTANYSADDLKELFSKGLEWYLFYKESLDAEYVNLEMTEGMREYLTDDKLKELGVRGTIFEDVTEDDWAYDAINYCAKDGLLYGYDDGSGKFGTYDQLTRAQAAAILCRYYTGGGTGSDSWNTTKNQTGMPDVESDVWYTAVVNWAIESGAMHGYDTGTFGPDDPLTREQLCAIVGNVAEVFGTAAPGSVENASTSKLDSMPDGDDVSDWAIPSVAWGLNNGVINGVNENDGRYVRPLEIVDRSMMAGVIMNSIENHVI